MIEFTDHEKANYPMSRRLAKLFYSVEWPADHFPWIAHLWHVDPYEEAV